MASAARKLAISRVAAKKSSHVDTGASHAIDVTDVDEVVQGERR